ncbi:MAG: ABC transporter substrate-binding protein, partial [Bacteroidota bacterium]
MSKNFSLQLNQRSYSNKLLIVSLAFALFASGLLVAKNATAAVKKDTTPYIVPIIASLTGTSSGVGIPAQGGMQAVFETLNAAGGINGHKINFTVLNDQSSPTVGATVALQAVGMNPTAIMSATNSTPFSGELPTLTQAGRVVLSNVTVNSFYPWFYSDSVNTKQNIIT